MLSQAHTMKAAPLKATPTRVAPQRAFTMQRLWRMVVWGATAASALLIAVLTTRSEVGMQRVATLFAAPPGGPLLRSGRGTGQVATRAFDARVETRRLADVVRGLATDDDHINSRLAALEHNLDDLTGSITRQIEAAKTAPPWPADTPVEATPPAALAAIVTPVMPPTSGLASPQPPSPLPPLVTEQGAEPGDAAASAADDVATAAGGGWASVAGGDTATAQPTVYGIDIGSAGSIQALRARWLGIHTAHPNLFKGLEPTVTLRDIPHSNRVELHLVVGPLASAEAAGELCAALAVLRLPCQPTPFDRQHVALR